MEQDMSWYYPYGSIPNSQQERVGGVGINPLSPGAGQNVVGGFNYYPYAAYPVYYPPHSPQGQMVPPPHLGNAGMGINIPTPPLAPPPPQMNAVMSNVNHMNVPSGAVNMNGMGYFLPPSPTLPRRKKSTFASIIAPHKVTQLVNGIPAPVSEVQLSDHKLSLCLDNPTGTKNIYIRNLQPDTTDDSLHEMMTKFGRVSKSKAILDAEGKCKGFGFAEFTSITSAKCAIIVLGKRGYQASFAKESFAARLKNLQDPRTTNLYICNIPETFTEDDLKDLLGDWECSSVRVCADRSRGVGFAQLESRDHAEEAIEKLDGKKQFPGMACVQVRFADSPEQKELKAQAAARRDARAEEYRLNTGLTLAPPSPNTNILTKEMEVLSM